MTSRWRPTPIVRVPVASLAFHGVWSIERCPFPHAVADPPLSSWCVWWCVGTSAVQNAFIVTNSHKTFKVYASDENERYGWVTAFRAAIDDLRRKIQTRANAPDTPVLQESARAPLWIPDDQVTNCHLCLTPFSLFRRKVCLWFLCRCCVLWELALFTQLRRSVCV